MRVGRFAGRLIIVVLVVFFFAAPSVLAGRSDVDSQRDPNCCQGVARLVTVPVGVVKELAVTKTRVEERLASFALHIGIDLFTSSIRRLGGGEIKDGRNSSGTSRTRGNRVDHPDRGPIRF